MTNKTSGHIIIMAYYKLNHQIRCIFEIRCELTILHTFSRVLIKADTNT